MNKYLILVVISLFLSKFGYSQREITIDTNKVVNFANEVFLNAPEYTKESYFPKYVSKLKQVTIVHKNDAPASARKLSSVELISKYNPSVGYDNGSNFIPEQFNPLKYRFNFHTAKENQYFIVDGTDYVIRITPR